METDYSETASFFLPFSHLFYNVLTMQSWLEFPCNQEEGAVRMRKRRRRRRRTSRRCTGLAEETQFPMITFVTMQLGSYYELQHHKNDTGNRKTERF